MNSKHVIYTHRTKKRGTFSWSNVFALALFAVLAVMLFLALSAGTALYSHINSDRVQTNETRVGTSLLLNTIRAVDETAAVSATEGPEGQVLVLTEHLDSGNYETRLYLHDGWIVKEYTLAGAALDPDGAVKLVASDRFEFSVDENGGTGVLHIYTDEGETVVALRSNGALTNSVTAGAAEESDSADGSARATTSNNTTGNVTAGDSHA